MARAVSDPNHVIERPEWLPTSQWPHEIHSLGLAEGTVAYTDTGGDRTLLLVHTGLWSFLWRDLIAALEHRWRCITLDPPGTGLSTGTSKVDLDLAADAVNALVHHRELRDVVLVVHDLGGPTALHAASGWTDRIRGLVAVNSFGWRPSGIAFRTMLALMGSAPVRESDVLTGWLPRVSSTRFGVGRHWDSTTRRTFRRGMDHRGLRSFHNYLRAARHHDYTRIDETVARLSEIPALSAFGEKNDPLDFQPRWKQRFTDIEQLQIPAGNHFPMCDDASLLASRIDARFQ